MSPEQERDVAYLINDSVSIGEARARKKMLALINRQIRLYRDRKVLMPCGPSGSRGLKAAIAALEILKTEVKKFFSLPQAGKSKKLTSRKREVLNRVGARALRRTRVIPECIVPDEV